jgi:hypothetical protein
VAGKHHDLVNSAKKYKSNLQEFFLDFRSWGKFKSSARLDWQKQKFGRATLHAIPQERGIYVFTIEHAKAPLPPHGYILYVGIAGDESGSTLRTRYGQYLRDQRNEKGRPAVVFMLKNWSSHLFFNFVPLADRSVDLARLERALLDSVMPPVNKGDFSAGIRAVKAARFS